MNNFDLKKYLAEGRLLKEIDMSSKDGYKSFVDNEDILGTYSVKDAEEMARELAMNHFDYDDPRQNQFIKDFMDAYKEGGYMEDYIRENTITTGLHMINEARKNDSYFFFDSTTSLNLIKAFFAKSSPKTKITKTTKHGEDAIIFSYEEFLNNYKKPNDKKMAWKDVTMLRKKIEKTDTSMDIGFSTDSDNPSG
tara:strand:- start:226 stop:807 length:582 start_codon:yes stop_codon:yes gene_type:complete